VPGPFRIDPKELESWDAHRFVVMMRELLMVEASRAGLASDQVDTSVAETVKDGGIDSRVRDYPERAGDPVRSLPPGTSAWQFKSGSCPTVPKLKSQEFVKPEVTKAIQGGEAYCFVTAQSITAQKQQSIRKAIAERYSELGRDPKGQVLTADNVVEGAERFPAIALRYFRVPSMGWELFEQWESRGTLKNPYHPDEARHALISEIRDAVDRGDRIIRIFGPGGVGKTRAALEAVRPLGYRERTLYIPDATNLQPDFFWYLTQENPRGSGILVVDECTADLYPDLKERAEGLPSGFTVVAVGPRDSVGIRQSLELGGLGVAELSEILAYYAPGLPAPSREAIVARCGGSPKLVVLLGNIVKTGGMKAWEELEHNPDVLDYINRRIFPLDSDDPQATLMRGMALFSRVGWLQEVSNEGQAVAAFVGLDWNDARQAADRLVRRGVLSPRGRHLYPTPDVLANYLTRETIRVRGIDDIRSLLQSLPPSALTAHGERLQQLGEYAETQQIAREFFGEHGFFRSLSDLRTQTIRRLFQSVASAYPGLTLEWLESVLDAPSEELLEFRTGRREVVTALQEIAWWKPHFGRSAALLLKLAEAENERYANNATGVWTGLFQVALGGTELPFEDRLPVLRAALQNEKPSRRVLGLKALESALKTQQIQRFGGGPPRALATLDTQEWMPPSRAAWLTILKTLLDDLLGALKDPDAEVKEEAVRVLESRASDLMATGLLRDWVALAEQLVGDRYEVRAPLLRAATWRLEHPSDLSDEERDLLHDLITGLSGSSFADRMRRTVGMAEFDAYRHQETHRAELTSLAQEVIGKPSLLEASVDWLGSSAATWAYQFGRDLGTLDKQNTLHTIIEKGAIAGKDGRLLAGYVGGRIDQGNLEWAEALADRLRVEGHATLVGEIIWRSLRTERAAARLAEMFRARELPAALLAYLTYGFWAKDLAPETVASVVDASFWDEAPGARSGRLLLIHQYVSQYPDRLATLKELAWRVLGDAAGVEASALDAYAWKELAKHFLEERPVAVAEIATRVLLNDAHRTGTDEWQKVLYEAIASGKWPVFEDVIGPIIENEPLALWRLENPFEGRTLLDQFDPDRVLEWISKDPAKRLSLISSAVSVRGRPMQGLARQLLVKWGDHNTVKSGLATSFGTGSWWGPESKQLETQIQDLEHWATDENRKVRNWAREMLVSYRQRLARALLLEEEGE
jgi:hypothetical protein